MQFFNYNNPVMQVIIKILHMIWINLLWLIGCIPIVTIGASTCGMYYSMVRYVHQENGYAGRNYWTGFKSSFRQAGPFWTVTLLVEALLFVDMYLYQQMNDLGLGVGVLAIVMLILQILIALYAFFALCYIARFQNKMKQILINTMLILIRNFKKTMLVVLILAGAGLILFAAPMTIFFVPVAAMWLVTRVMEGVYRQYMTDEQKQHEDFLDTKQYHD